ncbi:chaperone protein dnaJ 20, chloroplastic-like [Zingiber officinale]|uniref:chaperone protein dnaJ 20, chloroplastic-like n=1 Tax=Zingiber officinale TaxID=94328 RepID=UPI001C4C512E|nr:chaperone protein dnaJ 20, chloroplastic-like [Zingiber officinale]
MSLGVVPGNDSSALRRTFSLPLRRSTSLTIRLGGGPFQLPLPRFRGALRRRLSYTGPRTCVAVGEGAKARENFYELLGIPESGSFDEIKRAYKLMALKYHPDVSPPDRTEEYTHRFIEVQEAYETLSNPRLRVLYDLDLSRGLHLAFSARRRVDEEVEERSGWKSRWQDQLSVLKRRSREKDSEGNLSWGARMRRQCAESSHD